MIEQWERRRILIWGKTRPELSKKYREIVCTGGVFEDTKCLVRLYPIPLRYMNDKRIFKKYQWIEAKVMKAKSDPRPESYRIHPHDIKVLDEIPSNKGDWTMRAQWIMNDANIFQSVEVLQESHRKNHTSLGLVKPSLILDVQAQPYAQKEKDEFWQNYKEAISQMDLPLDPATRRVIRPITPPDFRFKISFKCNDTRCKNSHNFSILDWEIDALYFRLRNQGDSNQSAAAKVVKKLRDQICAPDKNLYFFLGNIFTHPNIFTIVGLWWPKRNEAVKQLKLFEIS
jgi:hypothetical protein